MTLAIKSLSLFELICDYPYSSSVVEGTSFHAERVEESVP